MFECILYMYICTMVASCQYLFNQNVSRLWQEMVWRGNLFQNMLLQRLLRWTRKRFISLLTIISMWFLNSFAINNFFHIHQKLNLYHRRKCLNRLHQRPHGEPSQCQRLYFLYIYIYEKRTRTLNIIRLPTKQFPYLWLWRTLHQCTRTATRWCSYYATTSIYHHTLYNCWCWQLFVWFLTFVAHVYLFPQSFQLNFLENFRICSTHPRWTPRRCWGAATAGQMSPPVR